MPSSNTCIGIYAFKDTYIDMFKSVIRPIVETHAGLTYIDALSQYESRSIKMDLISRMIADASLVIVDISENNPNVFFELGIAYAIKKPIILICTQQAYKSKGRNNWDERIPFDIRGNEVLIFGNRNDLKVKLGKFISDALYETKPITVSWTSDNGINHVKSSSELEIFDRGNIWSNVGINTNFTLGYRVQINNIDSVAKPDLRLFISNSPRGYPRIVIIFPWELSELDTSKYECHIDYFRASENSGVGEINHLRLQQVSVAHKKDEKRKEFEVFISFCWPNLVFESSLFEDSIKRLVVPISHFRDLGFPIHLAQFIGFEAINKSRVSIDHIVLKEVLI